MNFDEEENDFDDRTITKSKYSLDEIIVISPGTSHFKFGMASHKNPVSIPSHFAVRRKINNDTFNTRDELDNNNLTKTNSQPTCFKRDKVISNVLKNEVYARYLNTVTEEQIKNEQKYGEEDNLVNFEKSEPNILEMVNRFTEFNSQFIFGQKVYSLGESSPYNIIGFFRNGVLNIDQINETVLQDIMVNYFKQVLVENLSISLNEIKDYCVAFVVPLSFCKSEIMFFTEVFLEKMGFKAVLFHLEPVLACFGTGFSGACVVDVGDESTKVCCVQYGSVVLSSKIVLPYGGKDITELYLYNILSPKFNEFYSPFRQNIHLIDKYNLSHTLEKIKKETSSFPKEKRVIRNYIGEVVSKDGCNSVILKMTLSNVCFLSPMGLFYPKMFRGNYTKNKQFLMHLVDKCRFEYENSLLEPRVENTYSDRKNYFGRTKIMSLSLSKTVVESILSLSKSEDRMSMATSILLVGGTAKIQGLGDILEKKVKEMLERKKSNITHVEILPRRDEGESGLSPDLCSWLGMAIICGNEGCREMWITPAEWNRHRNLLLLRKKLPFELEIDILQQ